MNTFDQFLRTLKSEFKRQAYRHIRSLWADLEELAQADGESARAVIVAQALRRVRGPTNCPGSLVMLERTMATPTEATVSDHIEQCPVAELVGSYTD
jgi:hypothetical protein